MCQLLQHNLPNRPRTISGHYDSQSRSEGRRENVQNMLASMLHQINDWMARMLVSMEELPAGTANTSMPSPTPAGQNPGKAETQKKTALQVINDMVKARLTQPEVRLLDDQGRYAEGTIHSKEYDLLKERGLVVLGIGIGGLMFDRRIEEIIINNWSANWLKNAEAERKRIERQKNVMESAAREKALIDYAKTISAEIVKRKPQDLKKNIAAASDAYPYNHL